MAKTERFDTESFPESTLYYRQCASRAETPSISESTKTESPELIYQKWWLLWHLLILFLVSAMCIPMLYIKQSQIEQFYEHQSQCCYCLWVGNNGTVSNNYKIEWSPCALHLEIPHNRYHFHYDENQKQFHETNANDVCHINGITRIHHRILRSYL